MNTKNISESNKYRIRLFIISGAVFVTPFFAQIHRIVGKGYSVSITVFAYLIHFAPFLILSFMLARWAYQNRNFINREFVCRSLGVVPIYLTYLYLVRFFITCAESGNTPIGWIVYPISTPFIPIFYRISYRLTTKIYLTIYPEEKTQLDKIDKNTSLKASLTLKEMFHKYQEENRSGDKGK